MYAQDYIHNILESVTIRHFQKVEKPIFQQDNSRLHIAESGYWFWPVRSSDLSPFEHV